MALQQERKEEGLRVQLDIAEDVRGFTVAPLLLITFVENAFKYVGSYDDRAGEVAISLRRKGAGLLFRVYNTTDEGMAARGIGIGETGGIGIANARRRLDLQYPGAHELTITNKGDSFEVILHLTITSHVTQSHYSR